jgi:hypothetical protein
VYACLVSAVVTHAKIGHQPWACPCCCCPPHNSSSGCMLRHTSLHLPPSPGTSMAPTTHKVSSFWWLLRLPCGANCCSHIAVVSPSANLHLIPLSCFFSLSCLSLSSFCLLCCRLLLARTPTGCSPWRCSPACSKAPAPCHNVCSPPWPLDHSTCCGFRSQAGGPIVQTVAGKAASVLQAWRTWNGLLARKRSVHC